MSLYLNYNDLSESNQLDILIYNSPILARWSLIILLLMYGPNAFILSYLILFTRTIITDVYIRRIIGWTVAFWNFLNGFYAWMYIYLGIEIIREFLRFGVPYLLNRVNISTDPIAETLARRVFRILRVLSQQHPMLSCQHLLLALTGYSQKDVSEAFNEEEKKKLQKFFRDFSKTSFIYESDTSAFTIFFPSFIIRFSHQGMQITTDEAIKLIQGKEINDDVCPICQDKYADLSIELKCKHRYCHKCIFSWLNQQYTCPTCRNEVH